MWVVRLSDKQLEVVRAVLRSEEHRGPALEGALEALDLARWDDLPEAQLPWGEVESAASSQGVSEADMIGIVAGAMRSLPSPRSAPSASGRSASARRATAARPSRRPRLAGAAARPRCVALAGCGGDDEDGGESAARRAVRLRARLRV